MSTEKTLRNNDLEALIIQLLEIEDQRSDLNELRKAIMMKCKAIGYDTKIVGKVLSRKKREREEVLAEDEMLRAYEQMIGELLA